jgi:hypothetical protein
MKLSQVTLAVVALSVAASAFAAPTAGRSAISSGASATRANLKLALTSLCKADAATNVLTEFSSGNIATYVCTDAAAFGTNTYAAKPDVQFKNFKDTSFAELRLNVNGGSFTAVCALNNWPANTACATVNAGGTLGVPAPDKYRDPASGTDVLPQTGQVIVGGLMDIAPEAFPVEVTLGLSIPTTDITGVAQTFGVAVSNELYAKMFDFQKSAGGATIAKPIPNSCTVAATSSLECIPTISKGQMATIMAANEFNAANTLGAEFLIGSDGAGKNLEYNRRVDTSGTQAAAQVYFLGTTCSSNPLTIVAQPPVGTSAPAAEGSKVIVWAHNATGDVRNRLNVAGTALAPNYGIGIMSGENVNSGSWKWLRVQGAPIGENAIPSTPGVTNRDSVKNGSYDFYFESRVASAAAPAAASFWSAVTGSLNTLSAPAGLLNAADLSAFNKSSQACQNNSR